MKPCPNCGEQIQDAAIKCRFCGEMLDVDEAPPPRRSSNSNTVIWIVAAVAGGILLLSIPCLIALVLPAVQSAREAARLAQCRNNLRQISLALHVYHDIHGTLPPAYIPDENGQPMHSWRVLILPYLEQQALYDRYDFSQPWDSPANRRVLENMPEVFRCPSSPNGSGNTTGYAAVFGPDCIFTGAQPVRLAEVTDGPSNTLMVGEVSGAGIPWTKPEDVDVTRHPSLGDSAGFSSAHPRGVHFGLADGSVQSIDPAASQETLRRLFSRNDGEVVGDF